MRIGFHRWTPDAQELLSTDGRKFEIERNEGWNIIGELSGVSVYELSGLPNKLGSVNVEGGFGIFNVRRPDGYVKGYTVVGYTALNRDVAIKHLNETKPGISVGLSMRIIDRIEPTVRYSYIFTSGDAITRVTFGIGLLPN